MMDGLAVTVDRTEIRKDAVRGEQLFGPEAASPFLTMTKEWEGDFDSPDGEISQATWRDRRLRLAELLDRWLETVPISKESADSWIDTMGEGYTPTLMTYYSRSLKDGLQGRIYAPLNRFAAVAVASDSEVGRASIGELHTAKSLDDLGGLMLVGGMGLTDDGWHVNQTRYLVMNLDRDKVDPSLHLANVIGGLLFAERSWPDE